MRVSVYFKITPCYNWNDVQAYLKGATAQDSVEDYYGTYIHGLGAIKHSDSVPKEVKNTDMIGMPPVWHAEDVNISSEFDRAKPAIQRQYPAISLCKDNIADFCHDGKLQEFMDVTRFSAASDALTSMPGLLLAQEKLLDD
ncbi:hypothetical protein BGZ72_010979 [Mortierella alpina]|nr:hypothetical protein BGZ72_010979 [Mortierella alpina]